MLCLARVAKQVAHFGQHLVWSTPHRCPFKIPVILDRFSAEKSFGPWEISKVALQLQSEVFKFRSFCQKNWFFFKVWAAASIGNAATTRNFTVEPVMGSLPSNTGKVTYQDTWLPRADSLVYKMLFMEWCIRVAALLYHIFHDRFAVKICITIKFVTFSNLIH